MFAGLSVHNDVYFAANYNSRPVAYFRDRLAVGFRGEYAGLHAVGYYENMYQDTQDIMAGAGFSVGKQIYFAAEAGYIQRTFVANGVTYAGSGLFAAIKLGLWTGKNLGLSVVVIGKRFADKANTLSKQVNVDAIPFLSMRVDV